MKPCKYKIFSLYFSAPQNFLQNTSIVAHIYSNLGVSYSIYIFSASQRLPNSFIENLAADMLKGYKKNYNTNTSALGASKKTNSNMSKKTLFYPRVHLCVETKMNKNSQCTKAKTRGTNFF